MAGRPQLRIGQHGQIKREYLGGGVWVARCRYRDTDGVVRRIERKGPPDEFDKHGKLATDALLEVLVQRRPHAWTPRCARCAPHTGRRWPSRRKRFCAAVSSWQ